MTINSDFCDLVDEKVEREYGLEDGGDLCFNLLESGEIWVSDGVDKAAQIVAQRLLQP